MKKFILIALFLSPLFTSAQSISYHISGYIKNVGESKYAYLVNSSKSGFFLKVPLINNKFEFRGETLMEELPIKHAFLFMDNGTDITVDEYRAKTKTRVWEPGLDYRFRDVILEEVTFEADSASSLKKAKITDKGIYNLQYVAFSKAIKETTIPEWVKKYNDSNLTIVSLLNLFRFYQLPNSNSPIVFGDIKQMFNSLSVRLKESPAGLKLKQKIDLL